MLSTTWTTISIRMYFSFQLEPFRNRDTIGYQISPQDDAGPRPRRKNLTILGTQKIRNYVLTFKDTIILIVDLLLLHYSY